MSEQIEKMLAIGGQEWIKGNYHRIYFNNLEELYGLTVERYGTGNISSAKLNGEEISNSRAKKIQGALTGKFWYDVTDDSYGYQYLSDSIVDKLIEAVEARTNN